MGASQKLRAGRLLAKSQHGHPPDPRGLSVSSDEQELQESMAPPLPRLVPGDSNAKSVPPRISSVLPITRCRRHQRARKRRVDSPRSKPCSIRGWSSLARSRSLDVSLPASNRPLLSSPAVAAALYSALRSRETMSAQQPRWPDRSDPARPAIIPRRPSAHPLWPSFSSAC